MSYTIRPNHFLSFKKKEKNWFRLKVIKSGQIQLSLADAESCIPKAVFAAALTDAQPGPLLRLDSMEPGGDGNS